MSEVVLFQMGSSLSTMVQNLQSMGVFLYILPFLLALAIFYGALSIAFKDKMQKSAMGLISVVLAFFVMLYSAWNPAIVAFFASLSGSGLLIASGVLFVIIVFSLVGFDVKNVFLDGTKPRWIPILAVIFVFVLIFFGAGAGNLLPLPSWSGSSELWTAIFFIAVVGLAMWWMSKGEEKPASGK